MQYWGIVFPGVITAVGIFLMRQFFDGVPNELLDAARIDGLNEFGIFWRIALPLVKPAIAALCIFNFIGNWNVTEDIDVSNNQRASAVWDRFITHRFFITPLFAEYFRDPFQNINRRVTAGTGAGYQLIDSAKALFRQVRFCSRNR